MNTSITKQLKKISESALKMERLYSENKSVEAYDEFDVLAELLENMESDLANEDSGDFDWESLKNNPKLGHLPTKIVEKRS